jgi:hypothetical protein
MAAPDLRAAEPGGSTGVYVAGVYGLSRAEALYWMRACSLLLAVLSETRVET